MRVWINIEILRLIENGARVCKALGRESVFKFEQFEATIQSEMRREDNEMVVLAERLEDVKVTVNEGDEDLNSMMEDLDMWEWQQSRFHMIISTLIHLQFDELIVSNFCSGVMHGNKKSRTPK